MKKDIYEKIIVAGFGGQGVLYLGRFIAEVANMQGYNITWLPSYGPEMRGGTANCSVIISDQEIPAPLIDEPTVVIALNQPSFEKFYPVSTKELTIIDDSLVDTDKDQVKKIDATKMAEDLGNKKVANMIVAGVFLKNIDYLDLDDAIEFTKTLEFPKKIIDLNIEALKIGYKID